MGKTQALKSHFSSTLSFWFRVPKDRDTYCELYQSEDPKFAKRKRKNPHNPMFFVTLDHIHCIPYPTPRVDPRALKVILHQNWVLSWKSLKIDTIHASGKKQGSKSLPQAWEKVKFLTKAKSVTPNCTLLNHKWQSKKHIKYQAQIRFQGNRWASLFFYWAFALPFTVKKCTFGLVFSTIIQN